MGLDDNKNENHIKVNLTEDILRETCYWIIFKFLIDPYHKQQNSSRSDLIGGFIDRWLNRIPETLIFDYLLENKVKKNCHVINDTFLYTDSVSKNAPDILGLFTLDDEENSKIEYFPFTKFKNGKWYMVPDTPFLEMKTFRKSQNLVTIPKNQFKENHYYAIVESDIEDIYLVSLFDNDFISDSYFEKIFNNSNLYKNFAPKDEGNQLKSPNDLYEIFNKKENEFYTPNDLIREKIKKLGTYELLGIYNGRTIDKYSVTVGKRDNKVDKPLYLSKIENFKDKIIFSITQNLCWEYYAEEKCIPVFINSKKAEITVLNEEMEDKIYIQINGDAKINNEPYSDGCYEINFEYVILNATKYYFISRNNPVTPIENPIIKNERKIPSTDIIYKHYGKEKSFTSINVDFDSENSSIYLINNTKKSNVFELKGDVKFNDKNLPYEKCLLEYFSKEKIYYFNEKCKEGKEGSFRVSFPSGEFEFIGDFLNFDPIDVKLDENSQIDILKKNKSIIQLYVKGEACINNLPKMKSGFYELEFEEDEGHKTLGSPKEISASDKRDSLEKIKDFSISDGLYFPVKYGKKDYDLINIVNNSVLIKSNTYGLEDIKEKGYGKFNNVSIYNDNFLGHSQLKIRNIPFKVNLVGDSSIKVLSKGKSMLIQVEGEAYINSEFIHNKDEDNINNGIYKLIFDEFDRSSDKEEVIFSKTIIPYEESCEEELIEIFKNILEKN